MIITLRGSGASIQDIFDLLNYDTKNGPMLGQCNISINCQLKVDYKYFVKGKINSLIEKNSQKLGKIKILDFLNSNFFIWRNRTNIKTNIFVGLYNLRNTIFNIKPTSKRKVIKSSFKNNLKSLINILKFTDEAEISAYLYIPPIRQDYEIPYDLNEYKNFKKIRHKI